MMKKNFIVFLAFLALASCTDKIEPEKETGNNTAQESGKETVPDDILFTNYFAFNVVSTYYLWCDECSAAIRNWQEDEDPSAKVLSMRYKDSEGKDIDKWTQMLVAPDEFIGSIEGTEKTCGYDFALYWFDSNHTSLVAVVTYVYAGSPAEKAGMKRGDGIITVNGRKMTATTYVDIINDELLGGNPVKLGLYDGAEISLTPVEMYEDPVNIVKTIDVDGIKIGYMHYTSFGVTSFPRLIEAGRFFKEEGVKTLVLDLRYNGGGSVYAEQTLASILAPEADVLAKKVFLKTIYNATLTEAFGEENERFEVDYDFTYNKQHYTFSLKDAIIGLEHIYVIMTSEGSASASEAVVCGLLPYTDVKVVGTGSHGKYCGGYVMSGADWYEDNKKYITDSYYTRGKKAIGDWGIYVMVSKYADCNGLTPCMPNGFKPDITVQDDPLDGHQLGDPEETMLAAALQAATGTKSRLTSTAPKDREMSPAEGKEVRRAGFGVRILPDIGISR